MRLRVVLTALALIGLLAGCSSTSGTDTGQGGASPAGQAAGPLALQQQSNGAVIPGYDISIPKLHETSTLQSLGLNPDHTVQVPALANPMQAGVYAHGPMPGHIGPAVVLAHVNAGGKPGFGAGFPALVAGDLINFTTPTGPVSYKVTRTELIDKAEFPKAKVYSDVTGAELRLITCDGALDRSAHNYLGQRIVYAVKV